MRLAHIASLFSCIFRDPEEESMEVQQADLAQQNQLNLLIEILTRCGEKKVYVYIYIQICLYTYMYVVTHFYLIIHIYIYIYMKYMYIYICIFMIFRNRY